MIGIFELDGSILKKVDVDHTPRVIVVSIFLVKIEKTGECRVCRPGCLQELGAGLVVRGSKYTIHGKIK